MALPLVAELIRLFMTEVRGRAKYEAELDENDVIEPENLERAALTIILDF